MAHFTAAEILAATGGRLIAGPEHAACSGIATDSRAVAPGQCFIALRGERFDGHDFVPQALQAGAAGAVVSREPAGLPQHRDQAPFVVLVKDTLRALGRLAQLHRGRFDIPVIGVTGSTGKTTTKDMTAAILSRRGPIAATPENYNNEVGVPLALLSLTPEHTAAVIEMAMRGPGEIAYLASLAQPSIGVVTNIGLSHLERLGSGDAIADAKGELLEAVGDGVSVLNADDPHFERLARRARGRVVEFGLSGTAQFQAVEVVAEREGTRFRLVCPRGERQVLLTTPGRHQVLNALAAAAAAIEAGAGLDDVTAGLGAFTASRARAQLVAGKSGFRVLDDCYNASPASVEAALELLADLGARRKVAILGDMLELGPTAPELHRAVGEEAGSVGLDLLITVGDLGRSIAEGARAVMPAESVRWARSNDEAAAWALEALGPGDIVLVKASRAMAFERITERLTGD
jgi:UDP-N-acetylmuramoyl-tripeptide--D-alanyl-D-alanine ligase